MSAQCRHDMRLFAYSTTQLITLTLTLVNLDLIPFDLKTYTPVTPSRKKVNANGFSVYFCFLARIPYMTENRQTDGRTGKTRNGAY